MQILARNKYKTNGFNYNSLFILLFGALTAWVGWLANSNIFVIFTFVTISILAFIIATSKTKKVMISINESNLKIDNFSIPVENCIAWVMTEIKDDWEFYIKTVDFIQPTHSFYISKSEVKLNEFVKNLNLSISYNQDLAKTQNLNHFLRYIGIR